MTVLYAHAFRLLRAFSLYYSNTHLLSQPCESEAQIGSTGFFASGFTGQNQGVRKAVFLPRGSRG